MIKEYKDILNVLSQIDTFNKMIEQDLEMYKDLKDTIFKAMNIKDVYKYSVTYIGYDNISIGTYTFETSEIKDINRIKCKRRTDLNQEWTLTDNGLIRTCDIQSVKVEEVVLDPYKVNRD